MTDFSAVRPMTLVMENDPALQIVRLKNTGTRPWADKYNNRKYTMEPGEEIVVPFLAMCLWFGHPDAIDHPTDKQRQFRFDEWRRLQVRYGSYDNVGEEPIVTKSGSIPPWKDQVPSIEVLTMAGEKIITVVDDPEGRHLQPAQQNVSQVELMQSAIERMQEQMREMESRLATEQRAVDAQVEADEVRTDGRVEPEARPEPTTDGPVRDAATPHQTGVPDSIPTAPQAVEIDGPGARAKVIG